MCGFWLARMSMASWFRTPWLSLISVAYLFFFCIWTSDSQNCLHIRITWRAFRPRLHPQQFNCIGLEWSSFSPSQVILMSGRNQEKMVQERQKVDTWFSSWGSQLNHCLVFYLFPPLCPATPPVPWKIGTFWLSEVGDASLEYVMRSTFLMPIKRQDVNLKSHLSQAFSILLWFMKYYKLQSHWPITSWYLLQ